MKYEQKSALTKILDYRDKLICHVDTLQVKTPQSNDKVQTEWNKNVSTNGPIP
jgi:hypothetical protein